MTVKISLKETSQDVVHENITNAYQKGGLYCVYTKDSNIVYKYPIANIWRIIETYN